MPAYKSTKTTLQDEFQVSLNRIWKAQLTVTGIEGLPIPSLAGNVLKPFLNTKLSLRIPPTLNAEKGLKDLKELLEKDPPYDCEVTFENNIAGSGWNSRLLSQKLRETLNEASLVKNAEFYFIFINKKEFLWEGVRKSRGRGVNSFYETTL